MSLQGTVSKWVSCKGYGFIKGDDGQEAFVFSGAITGGDRLTVGKTVRYDMDPEAKKRNGPPAVKNAAGPAVIPYSRGAQKGSVKEWLAPKSYGFIRKPDGTIFYVHHSGFSGAKLQVGESVFFDVAPDEHDSGRKVAVNVTGPAVKQAAEYKGTVRRWSFEKRYGFITEEASGRDIFVHTNELGGAALTVGKDLFFDIGQKDGKEYAFNISGPAITDVAFYLAQNGYPRGKGMPPSYNNSAPFHGHSNRGDHARHGEERRMSPMNGKFYTQQQFVNHFGGTREWHQAPQQAYGRNDGYSGYNNSYNGYNGYNDYNDYNGYNSYGNGGGFKGGKKSGKRW
ncbi:hypothetical protein DIPPA_13420 [Diplonema papillatum]|nr:hypothetical protein DIPPA_13420 [Diplonema papillatum]